MEEVVEKFFLLFCTLQEQEKYCEHEGNCFDQFLNFVDFKENVCSITDKISEIKREIWEDVEIGYSVNECESLLERQNQLELKCAEIYSTFSTLRQQASEAGQQNPFMSKHYMRNRKFMEDVCYSLASEIVIRRDLITSSAKFHSFLFQFRNEIQDIKIFIKAFEEVESQDIDMNFILKKIRVFFDQICNLAGAIVSQGLQLFGILLKLKVSRDVQEVHRQHIGGWIAYAEVEREFRLKKLDQLVLRVHLLWQLNQCHEGIQQSIQWLEELTNAIIARSGEVGETAAEADSLFLQLIRFKDAAEESYKVGQKLIQSSVDLRKRLDYEKTDTEISFLLENKWKMFSDVFREVADRLDLSQNFYRNIEKHMRELDDLKATMQSKLKHFGEIRRCFVIQRYKKSWIRIQTGIQRSLCIGRHLLEALKTPVCPDHKVNLLSSSVANQIVRTMSNTERAAHQVQGSYFNDEPSTTEEYVSARSPDTWKSTSISGVEDWCSVGSGTTLDDFKSLEDDLAEEYVSEGSVEDLPSLSQDTKKDSEKKEYAAVVGVHELKGHRFSANIQPGLSATQPIAPSVATCTSTTSTTSPAKPQAKTNDKFFPTVDRELMAVSPKQAMSFEPAKYSSVITKTESTDVKTEVKTSYAMQTHIKAGGVDQVFTSHKSEDIQLKETTAPQSKVEKVHKIVVMDEPKTELPKKPEFESFPTNLAFGNESKANLMSELEGLKSKFFKAAPSTTSATESKSENVSYGFGSTADGKTTDVSRVVYSKEVTESHSTTNISFQQKSFGADRMEKWQSVTPQQKVLPVVETKETAESKLMDEKFKKLEQNIKELFLL